MQLNTGQWVVVILCAILILGFIQGYFANRQRAEKIFVWLREGLSGLGRVSLGEKLPGMATGGRLEVNQPAAPLKRVEVVYLLAPRENLLFMILHLLQGKRDELIVWINYSAKPEQCIEIARRGDRQFEKRLKASDKPALTALDSIHDLQVAAEIKPGAVLVDKVKSFLQLYSANVIRLAFRPEKPNLYLRMDLRITRTTKAVDFFKELSALNG